MQLLPDIVAHRGGKGPHMENTLPAFQLGIQKGVKSVEMDIRFDHMRKRFYLEHDFFHSPKRNFNLMSKVIAGIPNDIHIFVELKTLSWLRPYFIRNFVKAFHEILKDHRITVMSFNPIALIFLRRRLPSLNIGYLCGNPLWLMLFRVGLHRLFRPQVFLLHRRLFSNKNVQLGRALGMQIYGFVFNKEHFWQRGLDFGIDGFITDFPVELKKFLEQKMKSFRKKA